MRGFINTLLLIPRATQITLKRPKYQLITIIAAVVFPVLSITVPVLFVSGNDLSFQLELMTTIDYILLGILSLISALLVSMQIYVLSGSESSKKLSIAGQGSVGIVASLFGGITIASCGCSVGILLGLIGLGGGSLFIASHKVYLMVSMIALVMVGVYLTARRVLGECATCHIE